MPVLKTGRKTKSFPYTKKGIKQYKLAKARQKKKRGVPTGYRHIWKYRNAIWDETKQKDGSWKVNFRATKGKKSKSYGQFKKGFKIVWGIRGKQYATKTGKGTYQTRLVARKTRLKSGYKI